MWLIVILIVLAAALLWFVRKPDELEAPPPAPESTDDVDYDELERAEREVQEARAPEDLDRDWGPGAPRPPEDEAPRAG